MKKSSLFAVFLAITLFTVSCSKNEAVEMLKTAKAETSNTSSISSTDEPALVLSKDQTFANPTYTPGINQKIGVFKVQNTFNFPVEIKRIEVSFFSNSSTEEIPANAITNLKIFEGETFQLLGQVENPATNGNINLLEGISKIIQPNTSMSLHEFSSLFSPAYSFLTKLKVSGVNTTTGQPVSSTLVIGQTVNVVSVGNLAATFVQSSSTSGQYIACGNGGALDATVANYNFTSTQSSRTITELKYSIISSDLSSVTMIKVGSISAPVVAGVAWITGLNIPVPVGTLGVNVGTYISYADVGVSGATSGTTAKLVLTQVKSFIGATSYTDNYNLSAPNMMLVGSKPNVTISAPIGLPILVSGNYVEAIPVSITADPHGDIDLNLITFNVTTVNVTLKTTGVNNFVVKDAAQSPICNLGYFSSPSGGDAGVNFASCGGIGYRIPAGTTKTFHIFVPVNVVGSGSAYLYTKLRSPDGLNWTDNVGNRTFSSENLQYLANYPLTVVAVSN